MKTFSSLKAIKNGISISIHTHAIIGHVGIEIRPNRAHYYRCICILFFITAHLMQCQTINSMLHMHHMHACAVYLFVPCMVRLRRMLLEQVIVDGWGRPKNPGTSYDGSVRFTRSVYISYLKGRPISIMHRSLSNLHATNVY